MDITQNKNSEIPEQNISKTQNLGHSVVTGNLILIKKGGEKNKQALQCQKFPGKGNSELG